MPTKKTYFRDYLVILLITINLFIFIVTEILLLFRLSSGTANTFIVQYRPSLGISAYKTGSINDIISFAVFAFLVLAIGIVLSYKTYNISRQLTVAIVGMSILLELLNLIINNSLLALH